VAWTYGDIAWKKKQRRNRGTEKKAEWKLSQGKVIFNYAHNVSQTLIGITRNPINRSLRFRFPFSVFGENFLKPLERLAPTNDAKFSAQTIFISNNKNR